MSRTRSALFSSSTRRAGTITSAGSSSRACVDRLADDAREALLAALGSQPEENRPLGRRPVRPQWVD
jgi:hypothetical protein